MRFFSLALEPLKLTPQAGFQVALVESLASEKWCLVQMEQKKVPGLLGVAT